MELESKNKRGTTHKFSAPNRIRDPILKNNRGREGQYNDTEPQRPGKPLTKIIIKLTAFGRFFILVLLSYQNIDVLNAL